MHCNIRLGLTSLACGALVAFAACSAGNDKEPSGTLGGLDGGDDGGGISLDGSGIDPDADLDGGGVLVGDPQTCEAAAAAKAYVGCDFWPTVVANNVWSIFDYAVVVANAGSEEADVKVTGPGGVSKSAKVAAGALAKIYLPWVASLKGSDCDSCGSAKPMTGSVRADKSAYHLIASRPVTVYQFNALEYKGQGGEPGKSWTSCPGNSTCPTNGGPIGCFSFSNDASLLLPSTAMTGNYRVTGSGGWTAAGLFGAQDVMGAYVTITATRDGTTVTMKVGARGRILAGSGIAATSAGGTLSLMMNAGDVVELVGEPKTASDLSGSLITATNPVQVIAGVPCIQQPLGVQACDHIEESVFPAETLGKDYIVTVPTAPKGNVVGHVVRLYGNRDGTTLTYAPSKPAGAPSMLNAGDVVDLGEVRTDFRITGSAEFAVGSFMLGGARLDPTTPSPNQKGDPSLSFSTALEQYRKRYIFLAPNDYDVNYADIIHETGTTLTLDGMSPPAAVAIGATGYSVSRAKLGPGKDGAHELTASKPVGLQVLGYGSYTSYQYPGGLNLKSIAPPPVK